MTARSARRDRAGFTLVEVLIALSLLALLMLVLTGALRSAGQTEARVDQRLEQADQLRVAQHFLRQVLGRASIRPARVGGAGAGAEPLFAAGPAALAWVGVLPPGYGIGGRHFLRLALEPAGGASALVLRYLPWSDQPAFPDWSQAHAQVIVPHAEGLGLRYLDDRADQWRDDWPARTGTANWSLPGAVELQLTSATAWPVLVARMSALTASDPSASGFVAGPQ